MPVTTSAATGSEFVVKLTPLKFSSPVSDAVCLMSPRISGTYVVLFVLPHIFANKFYPELGVRLKRCCELMAEHRNVKDSGCARASGFFHMSIFAASS